MVAPEGWEVKLLGDIGYFSKGQGINRDNMHSGAIPCIRYGEIYTHHNNYIKKFYSHISIEVSKDSRKLRTGELLFAASGETKEDIGKCVAFIDNCEAYAGSDIIIFTPETDINSLFLGYYLNSEYVKHQKSSKGQGDAIVHILAHSLAEITILLPPLPEQRRIAEVLSDTDTYITTLEQLIVKKEAVKQGVMQELLTGKRRLPGFKGEWVEKMIDYYGIFISGSGFPVIYQNQKKEIYPFYKVGDFNNIDNEYIMITANNYISQATASILKCPIVPCGSIIFAKIGAAIFLERKRQNKYDCCIDNNMMAFTVNDNGNSKYIMYLFQSIKFSDMVTSTALPSLSSKQLKSITKFFPPTLAEQTAIAEILSDMDAELSALKKKLEKIRLIKQGMMDALLTGKIRLPEDKPNVQFTQRKEQEEILYAAEKTEEYTANHKKRNKHIDDAVMIAGIVNELYSQKYPLGRKKVQKCLYLLRRHQKRSTTEFKKKAAGPYADEIRYRGGEPIALSAQYIITQKGTKGTLFFKGTNIQQALNYIEQWNMQTDIQWLRERLKFKSVDTLELWATVDMAICDLENMQMPISLSSIKHLIATNEEWKKKLEKPLFNDANIIKAISELRTLFEYKSK